MKTLILLIALIAPLIARPINLTWDAFTPEEISNSNGIIIQTRPAPDQPWVEHGRVASNAHTYSGEFPDEEFEVSLVSFKRIAYSEPAEGDGDDVVLSELSRIAKVPGDLPIPKGFRINITISLETSENLEDWQTLTQIQLPSIEAGSKGFFRLGQQ